jgi:hypothetical protein
LLLGLAAYGLATYPFELLAMVSALISTFLIGLVSFKRLPEAVHPSGLLAILLGWIALGLVAPPHTFFPHPPMILFGFLAVVLAGVGFSLIVGREVGPRPLLPALILLVTAVTVTGLFLVRATSAFGIDVVDLHYAAADALQSGLSPYGLAVEVENGSPVAPPNSTIVGYPYPPLTALLYSASVWLFDDPRWIGLLAWLATLGLAGAIASRSERPLAGVVVSALAALPTWTLMIQSGSTEVLTLGLIAAALAFWRSGTFLGPVALGLAMASKQYFILSLPLLLIHPATRGRRAVIAVASASMTLLPLALDLQNAWGALVMFHANTPPRPDSSNLVGLLAFLG